MPEAVFVGIVLSAEQTAQLKLKEAAGMNRGKLPSAVMAMVPPPLRDTAFVLELRDAKNGRAWLAIKETA